MHRFVNIFWLKKLQKICKYELKMGLNGTKHWQMVLKINKNKLLIGKKPANGRENRHH
jgi:hypothetical protein